MLFIVSTLLIGLCLCETMALDEGVCTSIETKEVPTSQLVTYSEWEPYLGSCPGHFFRKCILKRYKQRTRTDVVLMEQRQLVHRCCHGYSEVQGICIPACIDGCVYSNCTGPNECTCYDGYKYETPNKCVPHCDGCELGTCLHPQVCFCNPGYDWDSSVNKCIPRCNHECSNGYCIAPNQCECNEEFVWDKDQMACVHICDPPCVFGSCIASNQCKCDFEYKFKNNSLNECEPICEMSCLNAQCIEPNVCECNDGFVNQNKDKPHECHCDKFCVHIDDKCVCLEESQRVKGHKLYENDTLNTKCDENNCQNGYCSTNGKCECQQGYLKYDDYTCVDYDACMNVLNDTHCATINSSVPSRSTLVCECVNGICLTNNSCACIGGYQNSVTNPNKCVPRCTLDCVNGYCSEPDLCECHNYQQYRSGYNESDWNICYPICDSDIEEGGGCINGTCIAPDTCQCFKGFELSLDSNFTCIPSIYNSDYITEQQTNHGMMLGCVSAILLICIVTAIVGYVVYRRHMAWKRSPGIDNYSSEPISFDCSEDL